MDHAGWIESNNSAINRYQSRLKDYKSKKLNDLQVRGSMTDPVLNPAAEIFEGPKLH
jgi:hypothetical protein